MAYYGKPDPSEEALARTVIAELARAMRYHDERRQLMKDRLALAMLDFQGKRVQVGVLAEASGQSEGNVRLELARARKFPAPAVCDVCGAGVEAPSVRCCCPRCGHKLAVHSNGLKCRECGEECGIDCSVGILR